MGISKLIFFAIALVNVVLTQTIISHSGYNNFLHKMYIKKKDEWDKMIPVQLFIAVITSSDVNKRIHSRHAKLFKRLRFSNYFNQGVFVSDSKPPKGIGKNRFINVPNDFSTNKSKADYHSYKQIKLKYALNDFIRNSDAGWFIYVTTDTGIVVSNFDRFMEELNSKSDPFSHVVFRGAGEQEGLRGHCLPGEDLGMLLSRKAVIEVLKIWDDFVFESKIPEDVYMAKIIHHFHQSMTNFHIEGFSTGIANYDDYTRLFKAAIYKSSKMKKKELDLIPLCPIELKYLKCNMERARLNRLVFYSDVEHFGGIEWIITMEAVPDQVKLIHTYYIQNICWQEKSGILPDPNRPIFEE